MGCRQKNPIIGVWTEKIATLTFQEDGTVVSRFMGYAAQGTYVLLNDDTLRMAFNGNSIDYHIIFTNDTMYLSFTDVKLTYTRVK